MALLIGRAAVPRLSLPLAAARAVGASALVESAVPVALLVAYEAAFRAGLVQARLLPPPSRVAATLWTLARTGELRTHVAATLGRVILGFLLGSAAGLALGGVTGASARARRLLDPGV